MTFASANESWAVGGTLDLPVNEGGIHCSAGGGRNWVFEAKNTEIRRIAFDSPTGVAWAYGQDSLLRRQTQGPTYVTPAGKLPTSWATFKSAQLTTPSSR